jgi:hypothetical protein
MVVMMMEYYNEAMSATSRNHLPRLQIKVSVNFLTKPPP